MQVTVAPAPDAGLSYATGHNTGISGTRHTVVESSAPSARNVRAQYADSGADGYTPTAELDAVSPGPAFEELPNSGIAILPGVAATDVPVEDPQAPQPQLNAPITTAPPQPVGAVRESRPGSFGSVTAESGQEAPADAQPVRVRDLTLGQRMRIWRRRALIMVIVGVVFLIVTNWKIGLSLAVLAGIADAVYQSRRAPAIAAAAKLDPAQRRTQRQLAKMQRAGYLTLHARPIPDSVEVIDHLVVGPTGVYAIDSERWHPGLPIRFLNGRQLWHGPDSKKDRLEHARWEARQASERLSAALGTEITVRPAMAVYGPDVPWDVATIRDVDVFSGPRLRKYLRRRGRMKDVPRLTPERVRTIYETAGAVLPGVAPARTGAPVG